MMMGQVPQMSDTLTQARTLLEDEKFSESLKLLHTITPVTSTVKVSVARALSGLGRWEEAHALFTELLKEDEDCHEGYAGRGLLYFFTGHPAAAHEDFNKAIEAAPMNGRYRGLRGVLFSQMGQGEAALKELEAAYDLGAQDGSYLLARAQIHLLSRNADKAEQAIALAERHEADPAAISALEGALAMLKGNPKEALASYRFATEKAPEAPTNWMNMLALTAQLERGRLLEEAKRARKTHPDDGNIIQVLVGSYLEANETKEALGVLKAAIKRKPENPMLYFQLGMGLVHIGKFEKAVLQFSKALEHAPRFPRALDARGNCLEKIGRKEEAQKDFEASRDIRQEDADRAASRKKPVAAESPVE